MGSKEVETKLLQKLIDVIVNLFPMIVTICAAGYKVYKKLPMPYVQLIIGSIICFFGGIYPTVFAALQVSNHNILYSYSICVCTKDIIWEHMNMCSRADLYPNIFHLAPHRQLNMED